MTTRATRFSSFLDPIHLSSQHPLVLGVGAIGHQLALALSQLPLGSLTLIDPDTVSEENLGPQGYNPSDINLPKVTACAATCRLRNPTLPIHTLQLRASTLTELGSILPAPTFTFLCVDSMAARSSLSTSCTTPLLDCRMASHTAHFIPRDPSNPAPYTATLFPDSEMLQEPCTGRSTPWCALSAAAIALTLYSHHLRGIDLPPRLTLNLNSLELFTP